MSHAWSRVRFLCPRCRYDVGQTLDDGFHVCPECGSAIAIDTCLRSETRISRRARALLYASWVLPCPAALASLGFGSAALFIGLFLVSSFAVYAGWVWVEVVLEGAGGAWRRAIAPALAVLVVNYGAFFVIGILTVALLSL